MSENNPAGARAATLVRYLDISIVLAAAPFVVLAQLPVAGYAIGAVAWIATRFILELAQRRASASSDPGRQTALLLASMMGRVVAIVAAVLVARYAGNTDDGIAAAAVVLIAFTVQLLVTITHRGNGYRPHAGGLS